MSLGADLPFTHMPGRRERHLRRRHGNPLFALPPQRVEPTELLAAQKADHDDMVAFRRTFRGLVEEAAALPPSADSEQVLALKERLEMQYEQACGLPEDQAREKEAIVRLVALMTDAVRRAAGPDPVARQELRDEEEARAIHFRLLEQPLVADMLHTDTPIAPDELLPSLLSAAPEEVAAALEVLDRDQLALLVAQGERLLGRPDLADAASRDARGRLEQMRRGLAP